MSRRDNPVKLGKHRDLFKKIPPSPEQYGDEPDDTDVVVEDWRLASVADLKRAAKNGDLDEADLIDMREYEEQADLDGDVEMLVADGMSRALAKAVADGLKEKLEDLDEEGRKARAQPFIDYIRGGALGHIEYEIEPGNDGYGNIVDRFQEWLEDASFPTLKKALKEQGDFDAELLNAIDDLIRDTEEDDDPRTALMEVLRDPANWELVRADSYNPPSGRVWRETIGSLGDQRDGTRYDKNLDAVLNGGSVTKYSHEGEARQTTVDYPGISQKDLDYAVKDLEDNEPYVHFGSYGRKEITHDFFESSFTYTIGMYEGDSMWAVPNADGMKAALAELLGNTAEAVQEDVVYRYSGTHDSVAGASGRGMYVARLSPRELRKEGATMGICIGTENLGHPAALRAGKTQVFSIRTESGKPKFTIELEKEYVPPGAALAGHGGPPGGPWIVSEVKGKANRLPGFEAGKTTFTKPDDLRLVTDFLLHLGYSPAYLSTVEDIAPGITAMKESGVDPFVPAPRKIRPPKPRPNPVSGRVRALLARTRPMGRFRV